MRHVTVVGAVSAGVVLAGGLLAATPASGQDASALPPMTARAHTPAGSAIKVTHAAFTHGKRQVKADVAWNKALLAKRGNHRYTATVVAIKGKTQKGTILATWSSAYSPRHTKLRFWLGSAQVRKARAAEVVQLAVSQQSDNPRGKDRGYERNYVSTVYLKGAAGTYGGEYRNCGNVKIEPNADLSNCYLYGASLRSASLAGANLSGALLSMASLDKADLAGANLTGVSAGRAGFIGTRFNSAVLVRGKFLDSSIASATLTRADLSDAIWWNGRRCQTPSIGICRQKF